MDIFKFAILDNENNVLNVTVFDRNEPDLLKLLFPEAAAVLDINNFDGTAEPGGKFDNNKFYPKQPHDNWIFDEDSWSWVPPIEYPMDGKIYTWNQNLEAWEELLIDHSL